VIIDAITDAFFVGTVLIVIVAMAVTGVLYLWAWLDKRENDRDRKANWRRE
jgi:hypothetical protein